MAENYTLGYTRLALDFVSRRSLESHGAFFIPYLAPGITVLDCGCGPGSITLGIATHVRNGTVTGVDMNQVQVELATQQAAERGIRNASFRQASVYALPFADASFDAVFSHALFEHLAEPGKAMREFLRVVRPGGAVGVCTPDWGGFLYSPPWDELTQAIRMHNVIQNRNGGDTLIGRKLLELMLEAGFDRVTAQARYENYPDLSTIAGVIALQLDAGGEPELAATARQWAQQPHGMFAQAWVSCVGRKPS